MAAHGGATNNKGSQIAWIAQTASWLAHTGWKLLVPLIALALVAGHLAYPKLQIDAVTLGLLIIAAVPWLAMFVTSVRAAGVEFQFRVLTIGQKELATNQREQQSDINTLKFLVFHLITEPERDHLTKLASDRPFLYEKRAYFENFRDELSHLFNLGFIIRAPNMGFRVFERDAEAASQSGQPIDVRSYFIVTNSGRTYLDLLDLWSQAQPRAATVAAGSTTQPGS